MQDMKWLEIIEASQSLLNAAQAECWDDLSSKAQHRDRLIREYFSKPVTVDSAQRIQDEITQVLAIDEQVLGLARREQEATRGTLKKLHTGRLASAAYSQQQSQF